MAFGGKLFACILLLFYSVVMSYDIIKALHLIAVIAWFAGLFYLPRLFVYHVDAPNKAAKEMLTTMERKLYQFIMMPAMAATWGFGIWLLVLNPGWLEFGWLHAKLTLVVLLTGYHHSLKYFHKQLAAGTCKRSGKFFRLWNEVPTLVLIAVVFLVLLKPF